MKGHEQKTGIVARKNFEDAMTKLFRVPKSAIHKPKPKKAPEKKDSEN